jgi:hypothetical protein
MKKIIIVLCLLIVGLVAMANEGDGLFWAAKLNDGKVVFYRSEIPTPGAATYLAYPVDYLKISQNQVVYMSAQERTNVDNIKIATAIAADIAKSNAAVEEAQAQLEAEAKIAEAEAKWKAEMEAIEALEAKIADKDIKEAIKGLRLKVEEIR